MITYTGKSDAEVCTIGVLGDGVLKTATIDLKKAPFLLTFPQSNFPVNFALLVQDGPVPQIVLGAQAVITIAYPTPLAAPTSQTGYSPRSQFQLWLLYQG